MKKQIALLVPEYRTDVAPGGGVSTVADFIYDAFSAESSWEVQIVSPRTWNRAPENQRILNPKSWVRGPISSTSTVSGRKVIYVGSRFSELEFFRYLPRKPLTHILEPFDAVVVVCGTPAILNSVRQLEKPIIAQVATTVPQERTRVANRGSGLRRFYSRLNNFFIYQLDKSGVKIPQRLSVENPWMENWTRLHGAQSTTLDIPGVDTEFFSPSDNLISETEKLDEGFILSVGRLNEVRKDFGLLIRSYAKAVVDNQVSQNLVIAGRDDLSSECYELMDKLKIRDRVQVYRNLSFSELRDLYRGADFFVMSSSEEGLGMVLIESLACGTPIISTATEGAKSVVSVAGLGTLVSFNDEIENNLAKAIASLANNPEEIKQQSKLSRATAEKNFGVETSGLKFRDMVKHALMVPRTKKV